MFPVLDETQAMGSAKDQFGIEWMTMAQKLHDSGKQANISMGGELNKNHG